MQFFKYLSVSVLASLFFVQCSSAQKLEQDAPFKTSKAYYQKWIAGRQGGGSGINVFIPVTTPLVSVKLDSLYFRGQKVILQLEPSNGSLFTGRIITENNQRDGFKASTTEMPFELNDNQAVISYIENGITKYFKIDNIVEKQMQQYPSAPPRNRNKQ